MDFKEPPCLEVGSSNMVVFGMFFLGFCQHFPIWQIGRIRDFHSNMNLVAAFCETCSLLFFSVFPSLCSISIIAVRPLVQIPPIADLQSRCRMALRQPEEIEELQPAYGAKQEQTWNSLVKDVRDVVAGRLRERYIPTML